MIYGDVCSGISAPTVAWRPLGWECAFYYRVLDAMQGVAQ